MMDKTDKIIAKLIKMTQKDELMWEETLGKGLMSQDMFLWNEDQYFHIYQQWNNRKAYELYFGDELIARSDEYPMVHDLITDIKSNDDLVDKIYLILCEEE